MFFHLTANKGKKNQATEASGLWYTTTEMFADESIAEYIFLKNIWLQ